MRGHLGHLLEQPLSHFGAAVVQVDGAVLVHMHQCARLVEVGEGEGDAEFHRRQGDPAFEDRILCVPFGSGLAPRCIVRAVGQLIHDAAQFEILDGLAVMCGLVGRLAFFGVEIAFANL